jgi:2-keto-4-pentenoate hydratase/2-oxohepta-3-ene-1,7-dioic acid hydratase in catechol pathway
MKLRTTDDGVLIEHGGRWVSLRAAQSATGATDGALAGHTDDALAFLRGGAEARAAAAKLLDAVAGDDSVARDPGAAGLPFQPRSMRAFMLWEAHVVQSSRMLVKKFFPPPLARTVSTFERVTHKTFPALKPKAAFYKTPAFYLGNHTMMLADGEDLAWPSHTKALDFELELAFVLAAPVEADATPEQARAAVGGWFVLNDWSARDVQADDARHNVFGPVVKAKTFANSMGCDVLTADALPDWTAATGRVRVDGEQWAQGATANPAHDIGAMLAHAAAGERLDAGDIISTGTMPGCCGLELDRWIQRGQTVELEIDGIGTLTTRIAP